MIIIIFIAVKTSYFAYFRFFKLNTIHILSNYVELLFLSYKKFQKANNYNFKRYIIFHKKILRVLVSYCTKSGVRNNLKYNKYENQCERGFQIEKIETDSCFFQVK